jgi:tetratricopeptide (TPR) repeat protein
MRELVSKYRDDLDATVLFAESLLDINPWNQWSLEGKPLPGTMEAVHTLESVLKRDPTHLGANHYYIHAVEASKHPEVALVSANRLKTLLPSSGHILHMPSHIYLLVGDYHEAARTNEEAVAADREYIRQYGEGGIYPVHYLSHNYYFMSRAYTMEGNFDRAKDAADELLQFYLPHFKHMPELEEYASAPLTVLITFHRWKDILNIPKPNDEMKTINVLWHFGRSIAFAHLGDLTKALEEQTNFDKEKDKLSVELKFGYNEAKKILTIADLSLKATLAEVQNKNSEAFNFLTQAVAEQDTLHYDEPPDWFFPIRETLGGLLLRTKKSKEAEIVFREELKRHPRNGRALFGLKESLKDQSKLYDYYWVNEEFQKAWKYSDSQLTRNDL